MSTGFPYFLSSLADEHHDLRRNWGWLLALGIALLLVGIVAISYPMAATIKTIEILGYLLVFGAAIEIASALWVRRWGGFFLHILIGLLYFFVGVLIVDRPGEAAVGYTLVLAMFFVAGGLFRMIIAISQRFSGWGWALVSGIITFLLGIMIWRQLPEAAFWVIGLFLGIDLIFNGWSWIMLGLAVRSIPPRTV